MNTITNMVRACVLALATSLAMALLPSGGVSAQLLTSPAQTSPLPTKVDSCQSYPVYHVAWELTARRVYDVDSLPDWAGKEHEFDCVTKTDDDAMNYAYLLLVMLRDTYTTFLNPADVREWNETLSGKDAGVGIQFSPTLGANIGIMSATMDKIPIASVLQGSPAARAKIVSGDLLLAIDSVPVSKIDFDSIAGKLDGKPRSRVVLTISHGEETKNYTLVRSSTRVPAISGAQVLGDNLGYIKLTNLAQDSVSAEMKAAMKKLASTKGIILDLRDNPGGTLDNDLLVAPNFIEIGGLMQMRQRLDSDPSKPDYATTVVSVNGQKLKTIVKDELTGKEQVTYARRQPYLLKHRPIIVLVNGGTASAAEMLVGSLLDNDVSRGGKEHVMVLGTTTFGKGIGQSLITGLPDGCGVKVTSLRYLTPGGYWPGDGQENKHGIKATYPVEAQADGKVDNQLATALLLGTFMQHLVH